MATTSEQEYLTCEHCGKTMVYDAESHGMVSQCPHCKKQVVLAGTSAEEFENVRKRQTKEPSVWARWSAYYSSEEFNQKVRKWAGVFLVVFFIIGGGILLVQKMTGTSQPTPAKLTRQQETQQWAENLQRIQQERMEKREAQEREKQAQEAQSKRSAEQNPAKPEENVVAPPSQVSTSSKPVPVSDGLSEKDKAAETFAIDGIDFNTTVTSFRQRWPGARLVESESDKAHGQEAWTVTKDRGDTLTATFVDGKVMSLYAEYSMLTLQQGGGWKSLLLWKLWKQFGPEDSQSAREDPTRLANQPGVKGTGVVAHYKWQINSTHRFIQLLAYQYESRADVLVVNTEIYQKLQAKKGKAVNVGF